VGKLVMRRLLAVDSHTGGKPTRVVVEGQIAGHAVAGHTTEAKRLLASQQRTRRGMGPCQGRLCHSTLQFLDGWQSDTARTPVFPVRVGTLRR